MNAKGGISMNLDRQILENIDNPEELERLYRGHPDGFTSSFDRVFDKNRDSDILKVWNERIHFKPYENDGAVKTGQFAEIFFVVFLSIIASISARLLGHDSFYFNLPFALFLPIALYFIVRNPPNRRIITYISALFLVSLIYINFLSGNIINLDYKPNAFLRDAVTLAFLHMPFFLWSLVGVSFIGNDFWNSSKRMDYLRFNGGVLVYMPILIISGITLISITAILFNLIDVDLPRFFEKHLPYYAGFGIPIIATYLVTRGQAARNLAATVAKTLSPLVLIMLIIYLIMIPVSGENPFTDRNFLLVFNIVLIVVLALTIFSISERGTSNLRITSDYINFSLILVALIIDLVALSAILFRLTSYGLTPNRIAVLGVNVLIFVNLIGIAINYVQFFKGKSDASSIEARIAQYLPVYFAWAALITFGFPLIFSFI